MKSSKLFTIVLPALVAVAVAVVVIIYWPRPARILERPFAPLQVQVVDPGASFRIDIAGDRVAARPDQFPVNRGFVEHVAIANSVLDVRGWAPMDVRSPDSRIIIRDPFGLIEPVGQTTVTPRERPDVERGHPDEPGLLHSGFFIAMPIANPPSAREWIDSLEFYAFDSGGRLFRLSRINQVQYSGWARGPNAFEVSVVYSTPPHAHTEETFGHIDGVSVIEGRRAVEVHGWAPMNLRSPDSRIVLRIPSDLAPVSILDWQAIERPDVASIHGTASRNLRYSGFRIVLSTRWRTDSFHKAGAVQGWAIHPETGPVALHSP